MNKEIEIAEELNPIVLSVDLYEFFYAHGKEGLEAMNVWLHLVYTARKQATNQVYAKNTYLTKGTILGEKKVRTAKSFLHRHNLIAYVPRRSENGNTIENWYIRVHGVKQLVQNPSTRAISTPVQINPCLYGGQMLKDNNKMLKNSKHSRTGAKSTPVEKKKTNPDKMPAAVSQLLEDSFRTLENHGIKPIYVKKQVETAVKAGVTDFEKYLSYLRMLNPKAGAPLIGKMIADDDKIQGFLDAQKKADPFNNGGVCPVCKKPLVASNSICPTCKATIAQMRSPLNYVAQNQGSLRKEIVERWKEQLQERGLYLTPEQLKKEQEAGLKALKGLKTTFSA